MYRPLEYTRVEVKPFADVTWEHARADGKGDAACEARREVLCNAASGSGRHTGRG